MQKRPDRGLGDPIPPAGRFNSAFDARLLAPRPYPTIPKEHPISPRLALPRPHPVCPTIYVHYHP